MYSSETYRWVKMVIGLFIASLVSWLMVILALQRPSFPQSTTVAAACPARYQEEYRSTSGDGIKNRTSSTGLSSDHDDDHSNARVFRGYGCAAHLFVQFGSYRGGNQTFTILGLASKPLHTYGHPSFSCQWIPAAAADDSKGSTLEGKVKKYYPDMGYGRVYTVVVITCTFDAGVGTDAKGGELILDAHHGDVMERQERIVALSEKPGDYNASVFDPPHRYDFLYCGSPLFGRLNARRVREWIAYHDMVFGERSHFFLYDAGGIHEAVREVLLPWIELGRVSVQDIRSTVHFDGYYYNQFLMVNDCLQRSKFLANWAFFFDLDEYIYVEPPATLHSVMAAHASSVNEVSFTQYRMAKNLCHSAAAGGAQHSIKTASKQWGFEKLTYRDLSSPNRDGKYVCNPRAVVATGIHGVQDVTFGRQKRFDDTVVRYYHYHGTIDMEDESELCEELSENVDSAHNFTQTMDPSFGGAVVQYDGSMVPFASAAKNHELKVLKNLHG